VLGALAAILPQGLLGGLTVLFLLPTAVSVAHALVAQTLLAITIVVAYAGSREQSRRRADGALAGAGDGNAERRLTRWYWLLLAVAYA